MSFCPPRLPVNGREESHRARRPEFCEVAIAEDGAVRSAGRIQTKPDELELFAQSLGKTDRVFPGGDRQRLFSRSAPALRAARASAPASGSPASGCARPSVRRPSRPRPPIGAPSPTGRRPRPRKRTPARHRGAYLVARQAGKQRGRTKPQILRFSSSSTGAQLQLSQTETGASRVDLTFMRRPQQLSPHSPARR